MRAIDFLIEYQQLDEVQMSPSSLKLLVKKIDAKAGMEFEMIVPNTEDPDDGDYEPDFDQDDRASSWVGIEDFFMGGDGNNSRRDVRSMLEDMQNEYHEWVGDRQGEDWSNEGRDFLRDYIESNDYFDEDEAAEKAIEELRDNNPEIEEDSDAWHQYIRERVDEMFNELIDDEWENQGRIYNNAFEAFIEDYSYPDEGDWLDSNYKWMTDVWENFGRSNDVYWPYTSRSGSADIENVAESFSDAIGRPCNASTDYHGVRKEGQYTVEPDGSLRPDNDTDAGLEFVSPVLPLTELIADLTDVVLWADKTGCYTNESTGLHMNVSVPNFSSENLDYVKLAILLGDEYVLNQFGRQANNYCRSAIQKVRSNIGQKNATEVADMLSLMKQGLAKQASELIHSGFTDKYTSINTKKGYIEFRSPGGDWLNEDTEKLTNTLYRFVVALDAACDPNKYKEEYYKKLYKLLNPDSGNDVYGQMINDFSQYVTAVGGAPQKVVADFRRLALATLKQAKGKDTGKWWWNVAVDNSRIEVVASNKNEAWQVALQHTPEWRRYNINQAKIQMIKPFVDDRPEQGQIKATAGEPQQI